jgi:hypothetical protein
MSTTAELLQKYSTFEYILLGDLRDLLEEPEDEFTGKWLLAVLDSLVQTLPVELELQELDGYLSPVTDKYPSWTPRVEMLHRKQADLFETLRLLRDRIASNTSFHEVAAVVRLELRDWMLCCIAQRRSETRLLQTAMNLDVGAGD